MKERLRTAVPMPTGRGQVDWLQLSAAVSIDVLKFSAAAGDGSPVTPTSRGTDTRSLPMTPGSLVEVNSGGRVLFCLFDPFLGGQGRSPNPAAVEGDTLPAPRSPSFGFSQVVSHRTEGGWGRPREGCVVLKFLPSRLLCQSEQFANELAQHLGVCAPDSRIMRQEGEGQAEWQEALEAAERIADRCPELHDEMTKSGCMLVLEFVPGKSLLQCPEAFHPPTASQTFSDLGRMFALDMLLGNSDRLRCEALGWRGNDSNSMFGERGRFVGRVVAIDAVVQRRPPGGLLSTEDAACEKLAELALNDPGVAEATLAEAVGSCPAATAALNADVPAAVDAFRNGLRKGLEATMALKGLMETIYQQISDWIEDFIADIEESHTFRGPPSGNRRAASAGSVPSTFAAVPGNVSPTYTTFKIRQINQEASRDHSLSEKVAHWKRVFRHRGDDLRTAVEEWHNKRGANGEVTSPRSATIGPRLTTGFLDGTHVVVDIYELKVRVEHMLQRLRVLQHATATARPTNILPGLFLSGAVEASSLHTLRHLGITHVLNATEDLLLPDDEHCFETMRIPLRDVEEESIQPHLTPAAEFIDVALTEGGGVLVHCHAGQSRSCTLVLAWLMMRRQWTLRRALDFLQRQRPQAAPNAGYMAALVRLEEELFGAQTVKVKKTKPEPKKCPDCGEKVGLSAESVRVHLRLKHPAKAHQYLG